MRQNPLTALFTLSTAIVCALLTMSSPAQAQPPAPAQPPTPTQPGQPPAQPAPPPAIIPVPSFVPIGETYRFEVSVDAWSTLPSTMMFSDTETITTTAATSTTPAVTTTITGTNIDFKQTLGLHNQWFPAFPVVIRPQQKHKIRFSFFPLYYKQSATLPATINFGGQTYLAGEAISSSLYWNEWQLGYEYDFLTFDRGYAGGTGRRAYPDARARSNRSLLLDPAILGDRRVHRLLVAWRQHQHQRPRQRRGAVRNRQYLEVPCDPGRLPTVSGRSPFQLAGQYRRLPDQRRVHWGNC